MTADSDMLLRVSFRLILESVWREATIDSVFRRGWWGWEVSLHVPAGDGFAYMSFQHEIRDGVTKTMSGGSKDRWSVLSREERREDHDLSCLCVLARKIADARDSWREKIADPKCCGPTSDGTSCDGTFITASPPVEELFVSAERIFSPTVCHCRGCDSVSFQLLGFITSLENYDERQQQCPLKQTVWCCSRGHKTRVDAK